MHTKKQVFKQAKEACDKFADVADKRLARILNKFSATPEDITQDDDFIPYEVREEK